MKLIDRIFLWWLERRCLVVSIKSDGLDVEMSIGGVPIIPRVEWIPNGHWHQRQIGPEDEQGMALFEADWISGSSVCDDCVAV